MRPAIQERRLSSTRYLDSKLVSKVETKLASKVETKSRGKEEEKRQETHIVRLESLDRRTVTGFRGGDLATV